METTSGICAQRVTALSIYIHDLRVLPNFPENPRLWGSAVSEALILYCPVLQQHMLFYYSSSVLCSTDCQAFLTESMSLLEAHCHKIKAKTMRLAYSTEHLLGQPPSILSLRACVVVAQHRSDGKPTNRLNGFSLLRVSQKSPFFSTPSLLNWTMQNAG